MTTRNMMTLEKSQDVSRIIKGIRHCIRMDLKSLRTKAGLTPTEAGMIFFDYRDKNTAQTVWLGWEKGSRGMSKPTRMYLELLHWLPDDILSDYIEHRRTITEST